MAKRHQAPRSRNPSALERALPSGLRGRLETARLDLRALFRAVDELQIAQDLPPEMHRLMELDADFAEALHVMDLPPPGIDARLMLGDTLASFDELPDAREEFLDSLDAKARWRLEAHVSSVRAGLPPEAAYLHIPGRDPAAG